ncbi:MAG TPA: IS110 family transposase [Caldithrix sp.]|nr:IS110 family transposase [Caldithrix sp.]HER24896.1 IS110 family transposase [Candidatus Atribacteria bacterium]
MTKKFQALQIKRQFISDKIIIGIDPAKNKHQAAIINHYGLPITNSFTFANSKQGYLKLLKKVRQQTEKSNNKNIVFSIETSCNLWCTLSYFLKSSGYDVLLVSPLTTKNSRPMLNHDFSRTDPKDALIIAGSARDGYFDFYRDYSSDIKAMHNLSIAYDKLRKNYVQQRNRIHSLMDRVFPEFYKVLNLDTRTGQYLLGKYFLPSDFINMDVDEETKTIEKISHKNHGREILEHLKELAAESIGIPMEENEALAERLILNTWLAMLVTIEEKMKQIISEIINIAKQTPYFKIITSLRGISDNLAALFIAEMRDLSLYKHYKQIEKYAGYNLRQSQSGNYVGPRHINHIGNRRLSWILYRMTEETVKYVPEVRVKFVKRQLHRCSYRKNIIASSGNLLRLIMSMVKDKRCYEYLDNGCFERLHELEKKYKRMVELKKRRFEKVA